MTPTSDYLAVTNADESTDITFYSDFSSTTFDIGIEYKMKIGAVDNTEFTKVWTITVTTEPLIILENIKFNR